MSEEDAGDGGDFPGLLTTAETAAIYRVARSTVTGWAHRGLLPHTRTPTGQLRFHRDTVLRLLTERQRAERPVTGPGPASH